MSLADLPVERPVVIGLGVTAQAVCRVLRDAGSSVTVLDDHPTSGSRRAADLLGVELLSAPSDAQVDEVVRGASALLPSPGVPDSHRAFLAADHHGVGVLSEFDLAGAMDDRPWLAVTGTDGKTTVITMVTEMLLASDITAVTAGNTEVPLVEAIGDPAPEVFVVEASSFRLAHSARFRPLVATWLNFAPDHLDRHRDLHAYESAKARIWSELAAGGTAVANADDPVVVRNILARNDTVTFGLEEPADYRCRDGELVGPDGVLARVGELRRRHPHDLANGLAAAATATAGGASEAGVRETLVSFEGLAHRVSFVAEIDGVRYVDDSKATVPHATVAALSGFESVVLIAGGRNKGVDLAELAAGSDHVRSVVAIGEAAAEVSGAFEGIRPVSVAESMADAVARAAAVAEPGDVVLLSPACASFDAYESYAERGDDFVGEVQRVGRLRSGSDHGS